MSSEEKMRELVSQLEDPSHANAALDALLALGRVSVPSLAAFLRASRPSSLPEARLLAVEGLAILRGKEALDALIAVAGRDWATIRDPAIRLGEEVVVSSVARALADFPEPRAHQTLLQMVKGKRLLGVAEAFEKLKDPRAVPWLATWLQDDFVAEAAGRALIATGKSAVPWLLVELRERDTVCQQEGAANERYRARILEVLETLTGDTIPQVFERHLDDPAEVVRWQAARGLVRHGNPLQRRRALAAVVRLLDSASNAMRTDAEDLLLENLHLCSDMIDEEIRQRRANGEPEKPPTARETTLEILLRIERRVAACGKEPS
jgi:HEAT repeat protein